MQPEDIDKLFRDRLEGHAPTPPAYLWNQLEEELQPAKKRPVLWMWATAAAVALLLVSGILWLQLGHTSGPAPLATTTQRAASAPQQQAVIQPEKKLKIAAATQATPPAGSASSPTEAVAAKDPAALPRRSAGVHASERNQLAAASSPRNQESRRASAALKPQPTPPAPEALAATTATQPERPAVVVAPEPAPRPQVATVALAAAPTGPIEVEVRRSAETPAVATTASENRRSLGGILLRQARNAVRGDRVSLAETGLPETVTVQAHVAGRTITKVIQL
ncbi:hypothetical protein J0X19_11945 [Hymenobacter sp. BT186]|uniref:Uncharacterized protein n=1 Tax=Hymenobacter telluris TaxID=2816474 RepID=A0A939JCS1_9BACT|nr:hypothetical protein [Hymenobacter telluris]MBO0358660.1 hypothetical protein [Hymenobacter telluris]MBW3374686.1 hypothetical protein [Hymenobacter norwichensis]